MGSSARHWKALMKKNAILWRRRPFCSLFEIICPVLAMLVMVFLRHHIGSSSIPYNLLIEKVKVPSLPGLKWSSKSSKKHPNGSWSNSIVTHRTIGKDLTAYMNYTEYPTKFHYRNPEHQYSLIEDVRGPLYFIPEDCLEVNSFQIPAVEMPIIAVVGEWNQATFMMQNYLETLFDWQRTSRLIKPFLRIDGKNATYPDFQFMNFTSKDELFAYTSAENYTFPGGNQGICYGFQISNTDDEWDLELYFNDQDTLSGTKAVAIPNTAGPAYNPLGAAPDLQSYLKWFRRGYETLHNLAANVILKIETKVDSASISIVADAMKADYNKMDSFKGVLTKILPFLFILIFIPPVYNMVSLIVKEKESRMKENMRMMGMTDTPYWLSWYVYYTLVSTIVVVLAWSMLMINVIEVSDSFLILAYLWIYAQAVFGFIVFLSSLFQESQYSGIVASLIYFGFSLIGIPIQSPLADASYKLGLSIFPQVAVQQITFVFASLEGAGVGLTSETMHETVNYYKYTDGLWMLAASFFVFLFLGLYLEAVLPKQYGKRHSPCCCFTCCCKSSHHDEELEQDQEDAGTDTFEMQYLTKQDYEPVPPSIARLELEDQYMKIQGLAKTYPDGFQAVEGINLKMYDGQIFALLGQNGAGKSTTMSMLSGLIPKTHGSVRIYGKDLFRDMSDVRDSIKMGVCPQQDILFDLLTPEEHLDIFYDFKGGDSSLKRDEITGLIKSIGVTEDKQRVAKNLSGGTKRKLSVAMALCGNSRFIMLDEPTAGMDLSARRSLWDMLRKYKTNRIILMSTHYMDEADILGDRIGIMSQGKIKCLGSSLFLKNRYGSGYKLTMVKRDSHANRQIQPHLEKFFGQVKKVSEASQEITFEISYEQASHFQQFFAAFDNNMQELGIVSYGISMTSLEEVFLKANGSQIKPDTYEQNANASDSDNIANQVSMPTQVKALMAKRFHIYKRDKCGLICELIIPILLTILGLCFLQVGWSKNSPAKLLDTSAFPSPQRMLFNKDLIENTVDNYWTPEEFAANLPGPEDYWQIAYNDDPTIKYKKFYKAVEAQRYVGDPEPFRFGSMEFFRANKDTYEFCTNVFFNTTSSQVVPYFTQYLYESILKTANPNIKFNTVNAPFPEFYVFSIRAQSTQAIDFSTIISIALAIIPCVTIGLIIKEREGQLKQMQTISGASLTAYWVSNMISDIVKTYIPICIILLLNWAFDLQYEGVWGLLLLYPVSIVPFTYVASFLFTRDTTAQIMLLFVNFLAGGIIPNMIYYFQNIPSTADLGDSMRWWFVWLPSFCVGEGIVFSSTYKELNLARVGIGKVPFLPHVNQINTDVYALVNLGGNYIIMAGTGLICVILLCIIESGIFKKCTNCTLCKVSRRSVQDDDDLDNDVAAEDERIAAQSDNNGQNQDEANQQLLDEANQANGVDSIRVHKLRKAYTSLIREPNLAVDGISFGVNYGECFGLLGVNGAGKSTTFKSLTGDIVPQSGEISIGGNNVLSSSGFAKARQMIGYCPQNNTVFPMLTVNEHMWLFAQIKGIPASQREAVIEQIIVQFTLNSQKNKLAGTLSGGNMRKLSMAIALIGNPSIILLDEPSTGMDPEARRFMWNLVEKISQRDKNSAVVLTTHSMEEVEALSTKMGIMERGGNFRCFGSSQHIKNKFATGFEIQTKIVMPTHDEQLAVKNQLGFRQELSESVNLESAKSTLIKSGVEKLTVDQISRDGLGSDLFKEARGNEGQVRLSALIQFCLVMKHGLKFVHLIASVFSEVSIIEQCGDFFKIRVPKEDKTIGYLFGLVESQKQEMNIAGYAVNSTTLEQIFQEIASQSIYEKVLHTFYLSEQQQLTKVQPGHKRPTVRYALGDTTNSVITDQNLSRSNLSGSLGQQSPVGGTFADQK